MRVAVFALVFTTLGLATLILGCLMLWCAKAAVRAARAGEQL
jgi:hypothetical protein